LKEKGEKTSSLKENKWMGRGEDLKVSRRGGNFIGSCWVEGLGVLGGREKNIFSK